MTLIRFGIVWTCALSISGCSAVPGDAALRGGNVRAAEQLYIRGAERGNPDAALRLGFLIEQREGDNPNSPAGKWFKRACELGSPAGCHNAALAYETGRSGLVKNPVEARSFYLQAAGKGFMPSQYNLAGMHARGIILPGDDVEGLKWLILAQKTAAQCKDEHPLCRSIMEDSPGHKSSLTSRLSTEQEQRAESLAAVWKPLEQR